MPPRALRPTGLVLVDKPAGVTSHDVVARARRVERFLSQPFNVAEQFTGTPGQYVPIAETIRGFKEIVEGKHDEVPESAFFLKGGIDDVVGAKEGGSDEEEQQDSKDDEGGDE